MKRSCICFLLANLFILIALFPAAAQSKKEKKGENPPATAAPSVFVEEKGKFRILVDGQPAGSEEFQISPSGKDWLARGVAEVPSPNGGTIKVTGKLELSPDGTPQHYDWSATTPKKASASIEFHGGTAKMELRLEGNAPFTQEFNFDSPRVIILDNNLYHHFAILARLYDWKGKSPQTYPVLIPQDTTPGTILVEYGGPRVIEGVKLEMLRVRSADLEIELYCDGARLVRVSVPSSKVEIVRE